MSSMPLPSGDRSTRGSCRTPLTAFFETNQIQLDASTTLWLPCSHVACTYQSAKPMTSSDFSLWWFPYMICHLDRIWGSVGKPIQKHTASDICLIRGQNCQKVCLQPTPETCTVLKPQPLLLRMLISIRHVDTSKWRLLQACLSCALRTEHAPTCISRPFACLHNLIECLRNLCHRLNI